MTLNNLGVICGGWSKAEKAGSSQKPTEGQKRSGEGR